MWVASPLGQASAATFFWNGRMRMIAFPEVKVWYQLKEMIVSNDLSKPAVGC